LLSSGEGGANVKALVLAGVVLIVLGIFGLAERGIRYTTKEEVARVGPIELTAEREKRFALPPAASAASLVAGVALVGIGVRKA
jgi:hypothetical protein